MERMEPDPIRSVLKRIAVVLVAFAVIVPGCTVQSVEDAPGRSIVPSSDARARHVVLDTDLAFDDIMALLYLLQRDDVAIDAVTIVGTGEAHCDPGVTNALGLLALGGQTQIPVACGRETPLQGSNAFPDEWRAAVDDLSMLDLPTRVGEPDPRSAPDLLIDVLDGDATLITLGPLTNIAEALRADPDLGERVPEVVSMAGAVDVEGNAPGGAAEYNVWVDPLAAQEVISGMNVTLVPLDATDDVPFTSFFADTLEANLAGPGSQAVRTIIAANEPIFTQPGYSFWDTLATALVFRPELATWDGAKVLVTGSLDAGAGWLDRWDRGTPVRFASSVPDPLAFEREYLSVLTGKTITKVRPEPTITIAFSGDRCSVRPDEVSAGNLVVAYEDATGRSGAGVLVQLSDAFTYGDLRDYIGRDGSVPPDREPPKGLELLSFIEGGLAEAEAEAGGSPVVAVCLTESRSGVPTGAWLSRAVRVDG